MFDIDPSSTSNSWFVFLQQLLVFMLNIYQIS